MPRNRPTQPRFRLSEVKPHSALRRMFAAAVLLRCPHCTAGKLYAGLYALHARCSVCGTRFVRDGGEWTGALWLTQWFGLSIAIALWALFYFRGFEGPALPFAVAALMCVIMAASYRHIKAWWIWIMYMTGFVHPEPVPEEERRAA